MKKFSKIKYAGVTAAALLAVSPVAAPVFSQATQGNTVSAADTEKDAATAALNTMNGSITLSSASKVADALNADNGSMGTTYNAINGNRTSNDFVAALLPSYASINGDTNVEYRLSQVDGMSGYDLKNNVSAKTKNGQTYPVNFTVTAYRTTSDNKGTLGTKNITINFTSNNSSSKNMTATFNTATTKVGDNSLNLKLGSKAVSDLVLKNADGSLAKATGIRAELLDGTGEGDKYKVDKVVNSDTDNFKSNAQLQQRLTFTVPAINNGTSSSPSYEAPVIKIGDNNVTRTSADDAAVATYQITRDVIVYNNNSSATPFFSVNDQAISNGSSVNLNKNVSLGNQNSAANTANAAGYSVVNGVVKAGSSADVAIIAQSLTSKGNSNNNNVVFNFGTGSNTDTASITKDDITNGIKSIGGSVNSEGIVSGLNGVNYVPVTVYSPVNNKSANIKLFVDFSDGSQNTDKSLPGISFTDGDSTQTTINPSDYTILQGQQFNPYKNVKVYDNTNANAPEISRDSNQVSVQNPVNVNVPGSYTVTYTVTNSQGKQVTVNRKVNVLSVNNAGIDKTVYINPAYGDVLVWNMNNDAPAASSDYVKNTQTVKTFDTKDVKNDKGEVTSYTRINASNSNQWVQTKFFDANNDLNKAPEQNNTNQNNGETPFEGVLTINYKVNGVGYRVFLRDGQANMQQQSVADGESYKVWAKKTVGNHTYYRIGTDAQWIEDTYAAGL